jgi:2-polyprenyl-3-methyl-5-hydroxy-6-metoxy-1,4-benzoquinol methylase
MHIDTGSRHITYEQTIAEFPEYSDFDYYIIMRSPWQIMEEHYKWCKNMSNYGWRKITGDGNLRVYCDYVAALPFNEAVIRLMSYRYAVSPPGFWSSYCGSEEVHVLQYSNDPWSQISEIVGRSLDVQKFPTFGNYCQPWEPHAVSIVAEICREDIEKFGYSEPEVSLSPRRISLKQRSVVSYNLGHQCRTNLKYWAAEQLLLGMENCRYVDVGALWNVDGETISTAARYTNDLTIIDITESLWPPVRDRLQQLGITCQYLPIDVLDYTGEPFDAVFCSGVIYHFPDPELLWKKLWEITKHRLMVQTVCVPQRILHDGRKMFMECEPEIRAKVEALWGPQPTSTWVHPDSEMGRRMPYCAMQQVYSENHLRKEARDHGWRVEHNMKWNDNMQAAVICEKP